MKKIWIVFALFTLASATVHAEVTGDQLIAAIENYRLALKSENPGLRHSAVHQLAALKSKYPEMNFSRVDRDLTAVSRNDRFPLIRLHADLTRVYLHDASLVDSVKVTDAENPMTFFANLYNEVNNKHLEKITVR